MYTLIQAGPNHLDDLALLFDAYRIFYRKETDITAAKKFLSDRLINNQSVVFMVYDGSRAAGFTQLYPLFSSVNMAAVWLLNDLFVDPVYRRKEKRKIIARSSSKSLNSIALKRNQFINRTNQCSRK